jgi:hypothetical protein
MNCQPASRPEAVLKSHEAPKLASIQLLEPALDEEQEPSLGVHVVPQTTESCYSSNAILELTLLAFNQPPELALEDEQEFSLESHLVPETIQRNLAPSSSYEIPLLTCNLPPTQALDEEKGSVHVSLERPSRSFDNVHQVRALKTPRGVLFSFVPEECVWPSNIKGQRCRAVRSARGHGKICSFLLLLMLGIIGMAQALKDCQILNDWLPKKFNEASCCEHLAITCVSGRITQMYVA